MKTKQKLSKKAIALLRKVQKTITEEPNRFNMSTWTRQLELEDGAEVLFQDEIRPNEAEEVLCKMPACGTVGCIGGWVAIHGLPNLPTIVINGREMVEVEKIGDIHNEA